MGNRKLRNIFISAALVAAAGAVSAENVYVYTSSNKILYSDKAENIAKISYEDNNTAVALYDAAGALLFKAPLSEAAYLSNDLKVPSNCILDVVFDKEGKGTDVSSMKNSVVSSPEAASTYYSQDFRRYVAHFDNPWGAKGLTAWYRVEYQNNEAFKNALASGHTLECVVMANYDGNASDASNNSEAKPFSSMEKGGTGFLFCKKDNHPEGINAFTFLPNVDPAGGSKSKWIWTCAKEEPVKRMFYHLVGVWDKDSGKSRLYINGERIRETDAPGAFVPCPNDNAKCFIIGGDATTKKAEPANGWKGDIAVARVYDGILTDAEIQALYLDVAEGCGKVLETIVPDASVYAYPVKSGSRYPVYGTGFAAGDKIQFKSGETVYTLDANVTEDGCEVVIPSGFSSASYEITLLRGEKTQTIRTVCLSVVDRLPKGADVIAHRGFWDMPGASQNSKAAVENACDLNVYGAEIDIWATTDNHLMVNHDASFGGVTIQTSAYDACKNLTLGNGEKMPQLEDMLEIIKNSGSDTKLIIEIKKHSTEAGNRKAASLAVKAVADAGLKNKVEYISFSDIALDQVLADDPDAVCAYLDTDHTVNDLHTRGHKGIDFKIAFLSSHLNYIEQAHDYGMTVNSWTINDIPTMIDATVKGIDFITTNAPAEAKLVKKYFNQ